MMENLERLKQAFLKGLNIEEAIFADSLTYNTIAQWDSVGHMALVAELEAQFDIMLDTDDIIDMSSVAKAKEILAKHGVRFHGE